MQPRRRDRDSVRVWILAAAATCALGCAGVPAGSKEDLRAFDKAFDESLVIETSQLPVGVVGRKYDLKLRATGRLKPFRWEVLSGELAEGLLLDEEGGISGVPTAAQISSFVVRVRCKSQDRIDDRGAIPHIWSRMRHFTLVVKEPGAGDAVGRKKP